MYPSSSSTRLFDAPNNEFDWRSYKVTTAAASEPVSLTEAKAHLKVEHDLDNDLITLYIKAATDAAERYTNRVFVTRTVKQKVDRWPYGNTLYLNVVPAIAVSSIKYKDTTGAEQTLATDKYTVDDSEPFRVKIINTWPATDGTIGNISIEYTAGYGSSSALIPAAIRNAILLIIGDMYENRQDSERPMPMASQCLLNPYRYLNI